MPLRWKTSGLLGSRRANAATNRQSAANRARISRLLGVNRPFIGCEGARQRFTQVAENAFFRYKSIIGDSLRARSPAGQGSETVLGCEILNRMTALGRPVSYRIGR